MATPTAPPLAIEETWEKALALRHTIFKELEQIQQDGPGAHEIRRFEKVEELMASYRLRCLEAIWPDIIAANEKGFEDILWSTHSGVTRVYRKVIGRLQSPDRVVLKRKVEKLYISYLKTAQSFYKAFLQRVCGRYDIKELKRIARLAEVQDSSVMDENEAHADAHLIEKIAINSCHKMLIYLGDLSRYRTLARPKDRHWGGALAYYSLANELIPESGHGYHQSAVIYSETGNHLEVVYHFYRALACDKPHPNALLNLEREFQKIRDGKARGAKGTNDAMISWFVKLHANYYKGEAFGGRKELEDEVDTRLAMALKKGTLPNVEMDLLKMVLINILAYQVGVEKIRSKWTDAASLSCQLVLLQNVRTIHTLSRLLREELVEIVQREPVQVRGENNDPAGQKEDAGKFTSTLHRVLPLLRVYMTWLCCYSTDIVGYKDHLEPQLGQMCKTLAQALNLLFDLLASDIASIGTPVPWRFPEDEETLGMKCLNGPELHEGCQLHYDPILRKPKPRAEDVEGATFRADEITSTRALHVISCALDLANQSPFPIAHSKILEGAHETMKFIHTEGGKSAPAPQLLTSQHAPSFDARSTLPAPMAVVPNVTEKPHMETAIVDTTANDSDAFSEDQEFYSAPAKNHGNPNGLIPTEASMRFQASTPSDLDLKMFKILNDYLVPPEKGRKAKSPEFQSHTPRHDEGPHGMGSRMASEVPGSVAPASPNPGSATGKAFPSLPWTYFLDPKPVEGTVHNSTAVNKPGWEQTYGSARSRPNTSSNAMPALASEANPGPLAFRNGGQTQHHSGALSPAPSVPPGFQAFEHKRAASLSSAHFLDHANPALQGHGIRDVWAGTGGNVNQPRMLSHAPHADPWGSPAGRWNLGQHSPVGHTTPQSSFSSTQFSGVNSSLPPVNSPWGVPMKTQQVTSAHVTQPSSAWLDRARFPSDRANDSSMAPLTSSNTGSISSPNGPYTNGRANDPMSAYGYGNNPAASPSPIHSGRFGGADMLKSAPGPLQRLQQSIAPIRAPFGPGANGRTNFGNFPKP